MMQFSYAVCCGQVVLAMLNFSNEKSNLSSSNLKLTFVLTEWVVKCFQF